MVYANFGVSVEMEGMGTHSVIDMPDEVECGTTVPARLLRVRGSGLLGWWPHEADVRIYTQDSSNRRGEFQLGDAAGANILSTYGEMLTGLTYTAAACDRIPAGGWTVYVRANLYDGGEMQKNVRTVHRAELIVSPETVRSGEEARIALATTLPQDTPITLSVDPAVGGFSGRPAALAKTEGAPPVAPLNSATLSTTVSDLVDARFIAASGLTETVTAVISGTVGGRTLTDEVTIKPAVSDTLLVTVSRSNVPVGERTVVHVKEPDEICNPAKDSDATCGTMGQTELMTVFLSDPDDGELEFDGQDGIVRGDLLTLSLGDIQSGLLSFHASSDATPDCGTVWIGVLGGGLAGTGSVQVSAVAPQNVGNGFQPGEWPSCGAPPNTRDLLALQLAYALQDDEVSLLDVPCEFIAGWADVGSHVAPQAVIDRLQELTENDESWWRFTGEWSIQELVDAGGADINMDYYAVRIDLPPDQDEFAFFEGVRANLDDYLDHDVSSFDLYPGDEVRWAAEDASADPIVGTVGVFHIRVPFVVEEAAVIASEYLTTDLAVHWRFSTLWASGFALGHPVSGTREFGIYRETAGTFVLYTRGVDRIEGPLSESLNTVMAWLGPGDGNVFDGGDALWKSLQASVVDQAEEAGGQAWGFAPLTFRPAWDKVEDYFMQEIDLSQLIRNLGCSQ